ncbi:DUF805 domain-containing protein [Nocardioides bruguierae]|uniref:DUF805 domain-containing protein n=1 Tax=Nocardioides bruguierae TaxID=2945102 RepID=A0A9X2D7K4_9ACTN|nr:DUF805 domain-containing protein [Nocardioides bruguierae]MCM0620282.1 DUF805 domain-containing protein [Nocardioides bruguierae]
MSFTDAVRHVLTHYADFTGRARRSEYWWFYLAVVLVNIVLNILASITGDAGAVLFGIISVIVSLGLIVPVIAVGVRRLHDIGRTGWWLLIGLVPFVGFVVLIVFFVMDSEPGDNAYGPSPKAGDLA